VNTLSKLIVGMNNPNSSFLRKINTIVTDHDKEIILDIKNAIVISTDPNYEEGMNALADTFIQRAEDMDIEYLRGILTGILMCFESDLRCEPYPQPKKFHYEMIPLFDSVKSYIMERSASI